MGRGAGGSGGEGWGAIESGRSGRGVEGGRGGEGGRRGREEGCWKDGMGRVEEREGEEVVGGRGEGRSEDRVRQDGGMEETQVGRRAFVRHLIIRRSSRHDAVTGSRVCIFCCELSVYVTTWWASERADQGGGDGAVQTHRRRRARHQKGDTPSIVTHSLADTSSS